MGATGLGVLGLGPWSLARKTVNYSVEVLPGVEVSVWTPRARFWQGPENSPSPSLGFLAGFLFLSSGGYFLRKQLGEEWKCVLFCVDVGGSWVPGGSLVSCVWVIL